MTDRMPPHDRPAQGAANQPGTQGLRPVTTPSTQASPATGTGAATGATAPAAPKPATPDARRLAEEAREAVQGTASDLRAAASARLGEAVEGAKAQAEAARGSVADDMAEAASALRRAAQDMQGGSASERSIAFLARGLADVSDGIRDRDLGQMIGEANALARRNPALFLGGAALLGFAAVRFAKAGSPAPAPMRLHPSDRL
ncbi:hypothetical protein [Frigidibacter sp. MR17.24]|uniref:hypothetical protein n=1 Tax=Frigidibacter sp. MR17.24 TaxID=3127345 RepID=UPI003012DBBC